MIGSIVKVVEMQSYILSYNLTGTDPDLHSQFLLQLEQQGWTYWILEASPGGKWFHLPDSTLTGTFASFPKALAAFNDAKSAIATIAVRKWIIVEQRGAVFDSDETRLST
jgi:hypothetical protein